MKVGERKQFDAETSAGAWGVEGDAVVLTTPAVARRRAEVRAVRPGTALVHFSHRDPRIARREFPVEVEAEAKSDGETSARATEAEALAARESEARKEREAEEERKRLEEAEAESAARLAEEEEARRKAEDQARAAREESARQEAEERAAEEGRRAEAERPGGGVPLVTDAAVPETPTPADASQASEKSDAEVEADTVN